MSQRSFNVWCLVIVLLGLIVRLSVLNGDLWLDEIWSIEDAANRSNWLSIFTNIRSDNNHPLYSVYLYSIGRHASAWLYRIPSIIAWVLGIIPLLGLSRTYGRRAALYALLFYSLSYVSVLYSSEARGYALMLTGALWGFVLARSWIEKQRAVALIGCWLICILAFLSHFSFIMVFIGLLIWSFVELKGATRSISFMILHGVPCVFIGIFYLLFLRSLPPGSGTLYTTAEVLLDSMLISFGLWQLSLIDSLQDTLIVMLFLGALLGLVLVGFREILKKEGGGWIFFASGAFLSPFLVIWLSEPRVLFVRYFYAQIVLVQILVAIALVRLIAGRYAQPAIGSLLVLIIMGLNAYQIGELIQHGRGQYRAALNYILSTSSEIGPFEPIKVSGSQDFRNEMVLRYYADELDVLRRIEYIPSDSKEVEHAAWYIDQYQSVNPSPKSCIEVAGQSFELQASFLSAPLSGLNWYLYRTPTHLSHP